MRHRAIYNVHSNVTHIFSHNEAYDVDDNLVTLDEAKVQTETLRLQEEFDPPQFHRDREESFPRWQEQLDLLFHDMTAGKGSKTGEWYKAIAKVKADNPKPE